VHRDNDFHGDHGYYRGGHYHGGYGAPLARAAVGTAAVVGAAAAIGSIAYSLPPDCSSVVTPSGTYENCGGVYYSPQYSGDQVTYVVVEEPTES